jgi:hypothetical protein
LTFYRYVKEFIHKLNGYKLRVGENEGVFYTSAFLMDMNRFTAPESKYNVILPSIVDNS